MLQAVAIICKRGILENSQTIQESLLRDVTQLTSSNNREMVGTCLTFSGLSLRFQVAGDMKLVGGGTKRQARGCVRHALPSPENFEM